MREKPQPPAPAECCESGCDPCVWDLYRTELQKWEKTQQQPTPAPQDQAGESIEALITP